MEGSSVNTVNEAYLLGWVENRKCCKITKTQVDPIDAHKNKTISMI